MEVPADVVGKHFVTRYYPNLFNRSHTVHRYYTHESRLLHAEAGPMGDTLIAKGQNEIQGVLMSMDHENCRAEILTVDALDSCNGSVFVLVTGAIHKGDITKKFVQSFFLFPGNGMYFVINDIFRYLDEETQRDDSDGTYESSRMASSTGAVPEASGFAPSAMSEEAFLDHFIEPVDSEQRGTEGAMYHQTMEAFSSENLRPVEQLSDVLPPSSEVVSDGKMSYAAILRLQSDSHTSSRTAVSFQQPVLTPEQPLSFQHNSFSQLSRARTPTKAKQEPVPVEKKVDLRSVFVKNLPANIMNRQLEDEMSRFGPLRPNRVSLKSNKSGLVYAFVDFEDSTSAQAAIEASPILIGGRKVYIEKRTSVYLGDRGGRRGPR